MRTLILAGLMTVLIGTGCASRRVAIRPEIPKREVLSFAFDKAVIRDREKSKLDQIAGWLRKDAKSVAILEGHADPIGPSRYNEVLAEDRAREVRIYLRNQGADPRRVTVVSKGEKEPVVRARGQKANQPNRRVEIIWGFTGS